MLGRPVQVVRAGGVGHPESEEMEQSPRNHREWEQKHRKRSRPSATHQKKKRRGKHIKNTDFWRRMAFSLNKERKEN